MGEGVTHNYMYIYPDTGMTVTLGKRVSTYTAGAQTLVAQT